MAWVAVGMAAVSVVSSISSQQANASAADKARAAEMAGASLQYASSENATNIMKAANMEATNNAIQEALRVGAANNQDVRDEVTKATSSMSASNEGLTSGRSQGRQMVSLQIKGNKALNDSKSKTSNMINQLTEAQDKATNDLNNKLFNDYQQMATVLTTPGAVYQGSAMETVAAGVGGAAQGYSIGNSAGLYDKKV